MRFRVKMHSDPLGNRMGMKLVEVFDDAGRFVAALAENPTPGILKFFSKHMVGALEDPNVLIPGLIMELAESHDPPSPYVNDADEKAMEAALMNARRLMHADPDRKHVIVTRKVTYEIEGKELSLEDVLAMKDREVFEIIERRGMKAPSSDQGAQVRTTEGTFDEEIPAP